MIISVWFILGCKDIVIVQGEEEEPPPPPIQEEIIQVVDILAFTWYCQHNFIDRH